jgi:hypothetical protein
MILAQQLTMLDWSIWKRIQYYEFSGLAWTQKDRDILSPNGMKYNI